PIVADLLVPPDSEPEAQGWIAACRGIDAGRLRDASPRQEVQDLIGKYRKARSEVLESICFGPAPPDGRWPKYAWFPTFVEHRRAKLEPLIVDYLESYVAILNFLSHSAASLTWEECFVLSALDCVVHWSNDNLNTKAALVGPWHPFIVAKRFMVQAALLA